jgi:hypothetical protein
LNEESIIIFKIPRNDRKLRRGLNFDFCLTLIQSALTTFQEVTCSSNCSINRSGIIRCTRISSKLSTLLTNI